jgi:hypothetical protein
MSKKIVTVQRPIGDSLGFDQLVNEGLDKGWRLVKREVLREKYRDRDSFLLYAELELDEREEPKPPVKCCATCYHCNRPDWSYPCRRCSFYDLWVPGTRGLVP